MNRRDYDTLVRFIKKVHPAHQQIMADLLATELAKDNSNFNYNRFVKSCGIPSNRPKGVRS